MKIMLVDDNPSIRRLIRRAVCNVADEIVECTDGDEALECYLTHNPDLVLMDVKMPRIDGMKATRMLKNTFPKARVIIVTDFDEDDMRTAAFEAGACGYALKYNLTELGPLLSNCIAGS